MQQRNLAARLGLILLFVMALALGGFAAFSGSSHPRTDFTEPSARPAPQANVVIVRFQGAPLASAAGIPRSEEDGQILLESPEAIAYAEQLAETRAQFATYLASAAPAARIKREFSVVYNGVAVELNGTATAVIAAGPNVAAVSPSKVFTPTMNVSHDLIGSHALWQQVGGQQKAGAGVKVGIIDSGIDHLHPFLTDGSLSTPRGYPLCDVPENCGLTSNKVIVAREYPRSDSYTAADMNGHGTHVSGTVAGVAGTSAPFASGPLSGVAPKAWLGNYNVFPGSTTGAFEEDIIEAIEDAVRDRMNVVNMSLGGAPLPPPFEDPMSDAVNAAVDAGVIMAIAAGNAGPGWMTIDTPGMAEKAITVGAITNPHFIGISVDAGAAGHYGAAVGDFLGYEPAVTADYVNSDPGVQGEGCEPTVNPLYRGRIVLIQRGGCNFTLKVRHAELAGAAGVLVYNNVAGDPVAMGHDGTEPYPSIPAVMISKLAGEAMRAHGGGAVTVDGTSRAEYMTPFADIMAGFSSRGPTVDYRLKPDVTAPGVNVYSSVPGGYAMYQGTSMASPHVAGAAALLRQANKKWTVQQVKSALSSTGKRPIFDHVSGTAAVSPRHMGTGRIDLSRAGKVVASFAPSNTSFGWRAPGLPFTDSRTITVTNLSGRRTYSVAVQPWGSSSGLTVTASPAVLTLKNGESATVTLTIRSAGLALGEYEGDLVFNTGSETYRVPYYALIDLP